MHEKTAIEVDSSVYEWLCRFREALKNQKPMSFNDGVFESDIFNLHLKSITPEHLRDSIGTTHFLLSVKRDRSGCLHSSGLFTQHFKECRYHLTPPDNTTKCIFTFMGEYIMPLKFRKCPVQEEKERTGQPVFQESRK